MKANRASEILHVWLVLAWASAVVSAGVANAATDPLPPDDAAAVNAFRKLGVSMDWGAGDNVWKLECRDGKPVGDAELKLVRGLRHIEILDLTGTKITDAGLANLEGLPLLRNLELDGTQVTDAGIAHLTKLPSLKWLNLNSMAISDAGLAHLTSIKTLEGLQLNGTRVTDAGLVHIQNLPSLSMLELAQYATELFSLVPAQEGEEPLQLRAVPNVPHPAPPAMGITDAGLARIARMKNLDWLNVSGSRISDKGMAQLKSLKKLENLFLDRTLVTDAGLAHLAGMTQLKWLWLSDTRVSDAGLAHLTGLKNLEMLILDKTKVTNSGLVHIKGLKKLKSLNLKDTNVNEDGISKAFPESGWIEYDRPPFDDTAAAAVNESLAKVQSGDLDALKRIVKKDPSIVRAQWTADGKGDEHEGMMALHFAARKNDLPILKFLLAHGAPANAIDSSVGTALHYAPSKQIAEALIAAGADVNARSYGGATPLHNACNREVAEVLLAHGADINTRANGFKRDSADGNTPLHTMASNGRKDVVALLLERGADVNAVAYEATPLYEAARYGDADVVAMLIAKGAKVNSVSWRNSPLQTAIEHNNPAVIKLLLKAGAELPKADKQGLSVLHSAILWDCGGEAIEALLKAGATVDAKTEDREPVSYSSDTPPDERPPVTGRRTPLHMAAEKGNLEAAEVLIAHGADVHAKTTDGETPLSLTRREEVYSYDPWFQGTSEMVKSWNAHRRKDIEERNANRKAIADRIRQIEREASRK